LLCCALSLHRNATNVTCRGLLNSISEIDFAACEGCNSSAFTCYYGADIRLSECAWSFGSNGKGVGPTIPYPHAPFRAFGHPFEDILGAATAVAERGEACDDERCRFALERAVSTHLSPHHLSEEEYTAQVAHFWDVYSRAKEVLRRRAGGAAVHPHGPSVH
jgi:hypothetical protein